MRLRMVVDVNGFHHADPRAQSVPAIPPAMGIPTPDLATYESNMTTWGVIWGDYATTFTTDNPGLDENNNPAYYDGQRVFFQIADYTVDATPWNGYANECGRSYRQYLDARSPPYNVQGWRRFPHGIRMDAQRTGFQIAVDGVPRLRDEGDFSDVLTSIYTDNWYYQNRSREIAYMIQAHIQAEKFGLQRQDLNLALYLSMGLNHISEWLAGVSENPDPDLGRQRFAPFMMGLMADALIEFYEWEIENNRNPDALFSRPDLVIYPALSVRQSLIDLATALGTAMFVRTGIDTGKLMYVPDVGGTPGNWTDQGGLGVGAFRYEDIQRSETGSSTNPAPDLNLLIAPLFAWAYKESLDVALINIGDNIWRGGIQLAPLHRDIKIFNQNYRWSFDYIKYRNLGLQNVGLI